MMLRRKARQRMAGQLFWETAARWQVMALAVQATTIPSMVLE
jgi:hypothetical protein